MMNILEEENKLLENRIFKLIDLTSNDGHPAAFFNCENETFVIFLRDFFQGKV